MTVSSLPKVEYRKGSVVKHDGYEITDHWFQVPLTHGLIFSKGKDAALSSRFADQTITVFAREVVNTSETLTVPADKRPYIVYLQGGPASVPRRPAPSAAGLPSWPRPTA